MARDSLRDQIALLNDPARLRKPAFAVIDRLDHVPPGEQVLGAALALVVMCESAGISLSPPLWATRHSAVGVISAVSVPSNPLRM